MADNEKLNKTAVAGEQLQTVQVTFARDFTLRGGPYDSSPGDQDFKAGQTASIPADRVGEVLMHGDARPHDARLAKVYGFPPPEQNQEG